MPFPRLIPAYPLIRRTLVASDHLRRYSALSNPMLSNNRFVVKSLTTWSFIAFMLTSIQTDWNSRWK
jgi:hypothetical protein